MTGIQARGDTHTHIYIYIERERETEREGGCFIYPVSQLIGLYTVRRNET
jgi:hypothetical protein